MALREAAKTIFKESLADCSIERAFERKVKSTTGHDGHRLLFLGDDAIDLDHVKHIRIIAAGKAAVTMLQALLSRLQPSSCDLSGILMAPELPPNLVPGIQFFAGGHPFPNEASFAGAQAALTMLHTLWQDKATTADTLCFFLISGGASAMMELPLDSTISLMDTVSFHRELVHSSATIAEINCVRKHFSAVKGGRLAMAAKKVPSVSLLVSDVPVGHLDALASGPTLPDDSTVEECRQILVRYNLLERFPPSVQKYFISSAIQETPKPGSLTVRALTLITADDMAETARKRAEDLGFHAVIDNTCDDWDYRAAAKYLLNRLRALRREYPRVCLISSGEVTVELPTSGMDNEADQQGPRPGVGGRNQHFALYAATLLGPTDASTVIFSAGSDGIDGHSQAAGAVVDEQLLQITPSSRWMSDSAIHRCSSDLRAAAQNALDDFDSSTFLERLGATIVTGATGNNLRDLRILLAESVSY
ncbi:MAG: DUF4147 domain-containing protein [Edaphobacter sp.]